MEWIWKIVRGPKIDSDRIAEKIRAWERKRDGKNHEKTSRGGSWETKIITEAA